MESRILTIPNLITGVRALGIPVFLYVYLGLNNATFSFTILAIGAFTDYADGKVARALGQESKLGAMLDPAIDRAYIAATVIALAVKEVFPIWVLVILIARDIFLGVLLVLMKRIEAGVFEVSFLGKAATFNLLYALPFLLIAGDSGAARIWRILGWAFAIWGLGLYLLTGFQYSRVAFRTLKAARIKMIR
jgi:cardiolipin synthase